MNRTLRTLGLAVVAALLLGCQSGPDFRAIDQWEAAGQYEKAWTALEAFQPQDDRVLERKIQLVLRGFVQSVNHVAFALKDLAPGETLDSVRQSGGSFELHAFDIPAQVEAWQKAHSRSAHLDRALGDFYDQVSQLYDSYAGMDRAQIAAAALTAYDVAWKAGPFTASSGEAYSVQLLKAGRWTEAVAVLTALESAKGETHRDARYNKGYALWQAGDFKAAAQAADAAYQDYLGFPDLQTDALLLAYDVRAAAGDWSGAEAVLTKAGNERASDARVAKRQMQWGLQNGDYAQAGVGANRWLHADPGNAQVIQQVLVAYKAKSPQELDLFFGAQIDLWKSENQDGVAGILSAMWAHSLLDDGRTADARPLLDQAQTLLLRQGPLAPEVKQYLTELRQRL